MSLPDFLYASTDMQWEFEGICNANSQAFQAFCGSRLQLLSPCVGQGTMAGQSEQSEAPFPVSSSPRAGCLAGELSQLPPRQVSGCQRGWLQGSRPGGRCMQMSQVGEFRSSQLPQDPPASAASWGASASRLTAQCRAIVLRRLWEQLRGRVKEFCNIYLYLCGKDDNFYLFEQLYPKLKTCHKLTNQKKKQIGPEEPHERHLTVSPSPPCPPLRRNGGGLTLVVNACCRDSCDERITPPLFHFQQADLNCNIQDDAGAFYGVTSQYESSENMTVTCSTKVCSFGKQVVEKVEGRLFPSFQASLGQQVLLFGVSSFPPPSFSLLLLKRQNDLKAAERRQGGRPSAGLPGCLRSALPCPASGVQCRLQPRGGALVWNWVWIGPAAIRRCPPTPSSTGTSGHVDDNPGGIQLAGTCLLKP
ncbi:hypothetical protein HPG69_005901 [Diceros bicornis minor]|uniref:YAP binding domain-containing protein n=1 Tax=Diceros bicornis minor TaxID=77932 RepID=A0A7J7ET59_DICBM|nr:hypothetical protein HPG69_005901 [Diceros bicornis minor]